MVRLRKHVKRRDCDTLMLPVNSAPKGTCFNQQSVLDEMLLITSISFKGNAISCSTCGSSCTPQSTFVKDSALALKVPSVYFLVVGERWIYFHTTS